MSREVGGAGSAKITVSSPYFSLRLKLDTIPSLSLLFAVFKIDQELAICPFCCKQPDTAIHFIYQCEFWSQLRTNMYYSTYLKLDNTFRELEQAYRTNWSDNILSNPFVTEFLNKRPALAETISEDKPMLQLIKIVADEIKVWRAFNPDIITKKAQTDPDSVFPFLNPILNENSTYFHKDLGLWPVRSALLSQMTDIWRRRDVLCPLSISRGRILIRGSDDTIKSNLTRILDTAKAPSRVCSHTLSRTEVTNLLPSAASPFHQLPRMNILSSLKR